MSNLTVVGNTRRGRCGRHRTFQASRQGEASQQHAAGAESNDRIEIDAAVVAIGEDEIQGTPVGAHDLGWIEVRNEAATGAAYHWHRHGIADHVADATEPGLLAIRGEGEPVRKHQISREDFDKNSVSTLGRVVPGAGVAGAQRRRRRRALHSERTRHALAWSAVDIAVEVEGARIVEGDHGYPVGTAGIRSIAATGVGATKGACLGCDVMDTAGIAEGDGVAHLNRQLVGCEAQPATTDGHIVIGGRERVRREHERGS